MIPQLLAFPGDFHTLDIRTGVEKSIYYSNEF